MPNLVLVNALNKIKAENAHLTAKELRIKLNEVRAEYVRWMLDTSK